MSLTLLSELDRNSADTSRIVFNILALLSEDQWLTLFTVDQRKSLINSALECDKTSTPLRLSWTKLIHSCVYHNLFSSDLELIKRFVNELYQVRHQTNVSIAVEMTKTLTTIWDLLGEEETETQVKILAQLIGYRMDEKKEKLR